MKKRKRFAVPFQAGIVDVGAHSIRLDIFEVSSDEKIELLESLSRTVNLGYDVFRNGQVSPETLARLSSVMTDFSRKLGEYRIRFHRVVATSAIREAFNRELVMNRIRNDSGLELEILEAQEETKISYLSMRELLRRKLDFDSLTGICLIVGTGSLLVSYFEKGLMRFSEEVPLGTVRLFDALGSFGVSAEQVVGTLNSQDIRQRLAECVGIAPDQPVTLIGMGASVRILAGMAAGAAAELSEEEFAVMEPGVVAGTVRRVMGIEDSQLAGELKLPVDAASSVAVCAWILNYFLEEFNCVDFICPGTTTRSALIHDLVRRGRFPDARPFHDDLIAVCDAIGRKYGFDPDHAEQVSEISVKFFEKLKRNFDFAPRSLLLLEVAARLHDIGRFVDTRQHHKHSWYLISNMQLPGISDREQQLIATISRYHRKSVPKVSHPEYTGLSAEDKVTVLKLASILRVADALDCSRHGRFAKMRLVMRGHTLTVMVPESGDFRSERLYLELKGGLFSQVFGLELKIEEAPLSL